jgi:hypothetical protein
MRMKEQNLGNKCTYAGNCPIFHGIGLPRNMNLTIWRNVFCYRGMKGWSNCPRFRTLEHHQRGSDSHAYISKNNHNRS